MNVTDLQQALEELKDSDDEMPVVVEADHGQMISRAFSASVVRAYKDGGEWFEIHPDDMDEWDEEDLHKVFLIGGE